MPKSSSKDHLDLRKELLCFHEFHHFCAFYALVLYLRFTLSLCFAKFHKFCASRSNMF